MPFGIRLRRIWKATPIDVVAFVVIALVMTVWHLRYIRTGMCFNDPSWFFHFGRRALEGDAPYRDYIFQVGPLPIYVDAGFQQVFGSKYVASLYAGLAIKILRVQIIWMIARRLAGMRAASALVLFCALDPMFAFAHHWSTAYAQLFLTLAGLLLLVASRADGRAALTYTFFAGLSVALIVSARQSSAVVIGVTLLGCSSVLTYRKEYFSRSRLIALCVGFATGLILVFGALALGGVLGPAIQQMFLDAPAKKSVTGVVAVIDALSGGAAIDWNHSWWGGLLYFLALPTLLVLAVLILLRKPVEISSRMIATSVIPGFLVLAFLSRDLSLNVFSDLPRMMLTTFTVLALLSPERTRRWLGLEPVIVVGLGALALASDWALEMSYAGRGWGDAPSLVVAVVLLVLASTRLSGNVKIGMCVAFSATALLHHCLVLREQNPFSKAEATDGTWNENQHRSRHALLKGLTINRARKEAVHWLVSTIPPGSTCFIYGNMPVVYDLVGCHNPTRVDTVAADFITAEDAEEALVALRAAPPDYLIAHERQWMSPPLRTEVGEGLEAYGGLNPMASRAMHRGLRAMLADYEDLGALSDSWSPELTRQASTAWDAIEATRIYRRRGR